MTCGIGRQINTRTKKVVESNGGTCTGDATESVECVMEECPGIFLRTLYTSIKDALLKRIVTLT